MYYRYNGTTVMIKWHNVYVSIKYGAYILRHIQSVVVIITGAIYSRT